MKGFAKLIMRLFGWKFVGSVPTIEKAVILSVPHTSFWDFIWGKITYLSLGFETSIIVKKEFFIFPIKGLLHWLGAIPVDRGNRKNNMVDQIVQQFADSKRLFVTITPEGSRKKRKKWKRGFYEIALKANVPVYMGWINYEKKELSFGEQFFPTGDYAKDIKYIQTQYKNAKPKFPEQFAIEY